MNRIKKNIEGINDTLYVCYVASKYGLKYKNLMKESKEEDAGENSESDASPVNREEEKKEENAEGDSLDISQRKNK